MCPIKGQKWGLTWSLDLETNLSPPLSGLSPDFCRGEYNEPKDELVNKMDVRVANMPYYFGHTEKLLDDISKV